MSAYASKYNFGLDGKGYVISQNKEGVRYYQKKKAPSFVNKFGGGDVSYRDATFWQYFVQTNWRNGSKQLKFDDPGKFWKSSDVDTTILEELSLSKSFSSAGQLASGVKVNALEAWRSSASWWNSSYGYRQQITITNGATTTAPVGYPVKVTVDTAALETATHLRSDRKDWRIVYSNGSTLVDLTRDYISTTVTFFALQAAIAAGASDSNYYIYYGYAAESTDKQPTTDADWNAVYGMYGVTPDTNSKSVLHMREGSGTSLNDDSSNSNGGTLTGSPSWGTDGTLGRYVTLDGSDDRISLANLGLGSFTMEGYFYFDNLSGEVSIFQQADDAGSSNNFMLRAIGAQLHFIMTGDGGISMAGGSLTVATWQHIAVTGDGSTTKIFLNGVQVATKSNPALTGSSNALNIGTQLESTYKRFLVGRAAHIRFSDTARTSFPYALSIQPSTVYGTETTTQPPSTSFDLYAGGSDGKVYKWDGATTWTEQFDVRRVLWYETGTDANRIIGDTEGVETAQSQGFQVGTAQTIKGFSFYLKKTAGTPGDITVRLETNTSSHPSGTLVDPGATAIIPAFTTSTYGWITVEFATAIALTASTTYHVVLKTAAASNDNYYTWAADASSPSFSTGANSHSENGGSTWTADATTDQYFRMLGQTTQILCMKVSSLSTQKLYIGTGDPIGQTNGDARLYGFDGTTWTLVKAFATATESMVNSIEEFSAASKAYIGVGPQARVYETADFSTFTLSKDVNIPQNPGYIYAMKEYNRVLHVGGGSPEFLPTQYYNGFINTYDTTAWNILYPFDFTVIKSMEFYDAYLFMGTYHGHLYVYDTSTLNPLFNFKDQYSYKVSIQAMKYFDDKLYIGLYPQENSNETNVGIWLFDRRGLTLAHTIDGVTGYRCFTVVNGLLFVGTGDNGYVYKKDADTYKSSGWYQSSYFDANLPSIDKLYNAMTVRHDSLVEGQSITIYYRFKESDNWTLLGLSNGVGDTEKIISFPEATYSKKITLKVVLSTTDTSTSPKLTEVIMQYSLYPQRKFQWTIRIKAKKSLRLLDGSLEPRSAEEIRRDLEDLFSTQQLFSFVDVDSTQHSVLMNDLDTSSWVINGYDTVNEEEVAITLLEA